LIEVKLRAEQLIYKFITLQKNVENQIKQNNSEKH
jgi:hypothetical protein